MDLSVRSRIALAMTVVVVANVAAALFSWVYYAKAGDYSEQARRAASGSAQASAAAERATAFVAEANALVLAVSSAQNPQAASATYGSILGADALVRSTIAKVAAGGGSESGHVTDDWLSLQRTTYYWVNRESETARSALRMTRMPDGRYRASVSSNVTAPPGLESLALWQLRVEARRQSEAFVGGALRRIARDADARAVAAARAEERARELARSGTVLLVLLSMALAFGAAVWLYGTIVRPLDRARRFADRVAAGDLHAVLEHHSRDEIGALTHAVEDMKDAVVHKVSVMREMAGAVLVTSEGVRAAAAHAGRVSQAVEASETPGLGDDIADVVRQAETLADLASQMLEP